MTTPNSPGDGGTPAPPAGGDAPQPPAPDGAGAPPGSQPPAGAPPDGGTPPDGSAPPGGSAPPDGGAGGGPPGPPPDGPPGGGGGPGDEPIDMGDIDEGPPGSEPGTGGPVQRGKIVAQEGSLKDTSVEFMFNPTEYTISKTAKWEMKGNKSANVPKWEFGGGDPRALQMELFFDVTLPKEGMVLEDVRRRTNQLFKFMMIDPQLKGQSKNSKMGQPPKCRLFWGKDTKNYFDCYITSCQIKYEMFDPTGLPVRARAVLQMKEVQDPDNLEGTNPTSIGEPGRRVRTVQEGDRLDWIAYQEYGDSTQWRRIAEANGIRDPLELRPGMVLAIPQ